MAIVCSDVLIDNFEILKEGLDKTCFKSNENTIILMQIYLLYSSPIVKMIVIMKKYIII